MNDTEKLADRSEASLARAIADCFPRPSSDEALATQLAGFRRPDESWASFVKRCRAVGERAGFLDKTGTNGSASLVWAGSEPKREGPAALSMEAPTDAERKRLVGIVLSAGGYDKDYRSSANQPDAAASDLWKSAQGRNAAELLERAGKEYEGEHAAIDIARDSPAWVDLTAKRLRLLKLAARFRPGSRDREYIERTATELGRRLQNGVALAPSFLANVEDALTFAESARR